jgi:hypothetical protein
MHGPVLVPNEVSRVYLFLANFTGKAVHMPVSIEFIVKLVMDYQKTIRTAGLIVLRTFFASRATY